MFRNRTHSQKYPRLKKFAGRIILATFATALVALFASAGISAKAFIFWGAKETVEVYPLGVDGDWGNDFQAIMLPEAGKEDDAGAFSGSNSAIYEGEARSIFFSDFGATRDEIESITEDDEIMMKELQQQKSRGNSESNASILQPETEALQPDAILPETGVKEEIVQSPEEILKEITGEIIKETGADAEQKEAENWLEIASMEAAYLNARGEASIEGEIVGKVKPGEIYQYEEEKDGWYKIKINEKKSGWVSGEYVIIKATSNGEADATEGNENINTEEASEENGAPADSNKNITKRDKNSPSFLEKLTQFFKGNKAEAKNKVNFADLVGKEFVKSKIKMSLAVVETQKEVLPEIPADENSGGGDIISPDKTEAEESGAAPIIPGETKDKKEEPEGAKSSDESAIDFMTEEINSLSEVIKIETPDESAGENGDSKNDVLSFDTDIDAKIIIWYSLDGDSPAGEWKKLDTITQSSTSNRQNGGYFTFDAPFLKNWQDLKNLRVKLEGAVGGETNFTAYLDGVWAEVEYGEAEGKNPEMSLPKKDWQKSEQPQFEITDLVEDKSILEKTWEGATSVFTEDSTAPEIKVKLTGPAGGKIELERDKDFTVNENENPVKVEILPSENLPPGKYSVAVSVNKEGEEYSFKDEFTWGVLAINANKSIYAPEEKGKLAMAVLDERGNMVCNAKLRLEILNPKSEILNLTTEDGTIKVNEEICNLHGFTLEPDYEAEYQWGEEGIYELTLTAETANGTHTISDKIEVKKEVPFDVKRITATRIYPPADYPVKFNIVANEDFEGKIVETVPASFEILPPAEEAENPKFEILNPKQIQNSNDQNTKQIVWEVDIKKGEKLKLEYQFNAPDVSPEFYLLGPLKFVDKILGISFLDQVIFQEARQWQIAADSPGAPQAMMVYSKLATDTYPYYRIWNGTSWGNEGTATAVSANVEYLVLKFSRTRDEAILGTMDGSGNIRTQIWNGSSWSGTTLHANVGTTNDAYRGFDIDYETSGDRAIIVYNNANAADPAYRIWNGSSWTDAATIDVPTTGAPLWIETAPNPLSASNNIAMILLDANVDVYGMTWNGSSWGNMGVATVWDASASIGTKKAIDVAYEQTSGESMFIWGDSVATDNYYRTWNGATLTDPTLLDIAAQGYVSEWVRLVPNTTSGSNQLMYGAQCGTTPDLNTRLWSGSAWDTATEHPEHDTGTENALSMNFDIVFETHSTNPNEAWLVWGDSSTASRKHWTGSAWETASTFDNDTSYVRLHANPWNGAVFVAIYQNAAGATNDDLNEYHLTNGTATWSSLTQIWAGATVADPVMFRVDIASDKMPGVGGSLGKSSNGWSGAIPVYMYLYGVSQSNYPYARASTTPAVGSAFYTTMTWSAANNRFEGVIYPGSNYCNGCADPNTGTFTVTVQLDNNSDFSSIDYSASAGTFTTYITRRWNAINNTAMGNSTEFNPTWNAGGWWDYSIEDLNIGGTAAAQTNVAIAIPFHPTTATITNMAVTLAGVSLSQGTAASTTDCWWWDTPTHTLYIQNDSAALGTYYTVTLNFDSDTDLFATRIDEVETYNMGERLFYNGMMWGNNYIGTAMFGGGHEGAGEQMELQARDFATNNDVSIDCMERVAVHVDNTIAADASAYYSADIKWKQQEWASYIVSEDNNSIVTRVTSDGAASGWQQQLNNGIAAVRDQTFYANKRYIKNVYTLTNNGASTRIYPMVWGREQWIGTDRDLLDEGRYDGDTADRTPETHVAISSLTDPWMTSYDTGVYAAMGMCFQRADPARYGYFLTLTALTNATPWAEWVNQGTEYRPDDNDAGTNAIDTFFDRNYSSVAPSNSVSFTFWQWGYDTTSWANIESAISADCAELNPTGITVSGTVYTDEAKTTPITDGRTVHLFVNSTDYSTTTTLSGAYSFGSVTVAAGDSVIVYLDGVAEDGSVVTLAADSSTAIADLDIITSHISLEHRATGPITNTDLDDIDAVDAGNEDGITINTGNAAFADGFELYILSGENYTPGGTVECDDFELEGTGSFVPSANAVTVSGDWEMSSSGTFTTSGTVTFDGAAAQSIITGGKSFSALTLNNTGADGTADNITISGALDVNGAFTITNGDLYLTTNNPNVNTAGSVSIGSSAFITKGTGTWTFDGTTSFVDSSTGGPQNIGLAAVNGTSLTLGSSMKVDKMTVTAGALNLASSGYTLTLAGSGTGTSRPLYMNGGTLGEGTNSTVRFYGVSDSEIQAETYYNLELYAPGAAEPIYTLGTTTSQTITVSNNLTITNAPEVNASTYNIILDIDGDFSITGDATFIASGSAGFSVGGSWSNVGTFVHTSGTVTFNSTDGGETIFDGTYPFHNLVFSGTGGEWLYTDGSSVAANSTSVSAGTPTLLNVKAGTVSVTGGTLNVDWYLGTHAVNAAATGTNIDTGDADITISEANSASAVWRHNGSIWGSAAASQTTGTAASGINPQPNADGAIRIREYSMTASATCPGAGCTLYKYNEQIDWVGTYGEYDYHDDYGENYLTSCRAGATVSCSDDTVDDDTIGVGWYRETSSIINTPYNTVNTPPTQGSWYVGMLEAIDFNIDTYTRDFSTITPGGSPTDLTNTLTVTTSASHGYVIYAREEQPMTCSASAACGTADIDDWSGTNAIPTTWNAGSYGFGYSTNDYDLPAGEGNVDRFSGPKFAGFIDTGFGDPVADRIGPSSAQANIITYRIAADAIQNAGPYQTSIYYVVVPTY